MRTVGGGVLCALLSCLALILAAGPGLAAEISLAWQAASGGYAHRVYHGPSSHAYDDFVDVGANTSATVAGLEPGRAYYFAVTSRQGEEESGYSGEVRHFVPMAVGDSDGDGLSDADEAAYGTDPERYDSNGDGVSDAEAVAYWGTAWNADADGDGLINLLDPTPGNNAPTPAVSPYAGWWYNPESPGTGLAVDAHGQVLYLAWYVYDANGAPVWYVSLATWNQSEGRFEGELLSSSGPPLGSVEGRYSTRNVGYAFVSLGAEGKLVFAYTFGLKSGAQSLTKLMPRLAPGEPDPRDLAGWWWDPSHAGTGFFLEAGGDTLYLVWYHYDESGSPRWWGFGGGLDIGGFPAGSTTYTSDLMEFRGGQTIGGAWLAPELTWLDPATLTVNGDGTLAFAALGHVYDLVRFDFASLAGQ